jgi:hypothetical protein
MRNCDAGDTARPFLLASLPMRLDLGGHPIHTRALSVTVAMRPDGKLGVTADIVDLRKRGFVPVGTELQGAGIIHQLSVEAAVDRTAGTIEEVVARQPVIAFEASAATSGESCRDVAGGLAALVGMPIDARSSDRLRAAIGGATGCSHLLAAAQLLCTTLSWAKETGALDLDARRWAASTYARLFRRDLVFDGNELADGRMAIGVQLSEVCLAPANADAAPIERFVAHYEMRLRLELDGWPATIAEVGGAERRRAREGFAESTWEDLGGLLAPLRATVLGKGATRELIRVLGANPPVLDAMLMLGPALIQCRASFPDKWLNVAATREGHPGLVGMADSCYMWRRGGALERLRGSGGS